MREHKLSGVVPGTSIPFLLEVRYSPQTRNRCWHARRAPTVPVGQGSQEHAQVSLRKATSLEVGDQSLCASLERRAAVAIPCDAIPLGQLLLGWCVRGKT